jgi:hypothetical protein
LETAIDPFSGVTIGDLNDGGIDGDTLTITQTGTGTLTDGAGFGGLTPTDGHGWRLYNHRHRLGDHERARCALLRVGRWSR